MIISQTQAWIKEVVVALGFCPFAARVVEGERIAYHVLEGEDLNFFLLKLVEAFHALDQDEKIETSFLIFPEAFVVFEDYLEAFAMAEELLIIQGYEGMYQLASFHPMYCFEGQAEDDPANFTNRAPYPMWHLLREESVERAVAAHSAPEDIPTRNIALARQKGNAYFEAILHKINKES